MSSSKLPRKKQALKYTSPLMTVIRNAGPLSPELVLDLRLREWSSITAFAEGTATATDIGLLAGMLRMTQCGIEMGIGPEAEAACEAAEAVLRAARLRAAIKVPVRLEGDAIDAIRELQAFHDLQRQVATRGQYVQMAERAERAGLDGAGMASTSPLPSALDVS